MGEETLGYRGRIPISEESIKREITVLSAKKTLVLQMASQRQEEMRAWRTLVRDFAAFSAFGGEALDKWCTAHKCVQEVVAQQDEIMVAEANQALAIAEFMLKEAKNPSSLLVPPGSRAS